MSEWNEGNLPTVDAIKAIRHDPAKYGFADHRGPALVCRVVSDAVFSDVTNVEVRRSGDWWIVQAQEDWLVRAAALTHRVVAADLAIESLFRRIVELPRRGRFSPRAEVFLTALAEAVVTFGGDGVIWISGEDQRGTLPPDLNLSSLPKGCGRLIAFKLSSD